MQSFLIPTANEIWAMHSNDVEMTFYDGKQRRVRMHAIFLAEISKLSASVVDLLDVTERCLVATASSRAPASFAIVTTIHLAC